MATYCKIPHEVKVKGESVAFGRWVAFTTFWKSYKVFGRLTNDLDKGKCPAHGYVTIKKERFYYCLVGLFEDPDIYTNPKKSSKKN